MTDDSRSAIPDPLTLTATTFVEIVQTLVHRVGAIDVLSVLTERVVTLVDAIAAGVLIANANGDLLAAGASTDHMESLDQWQIQNEQGPCIDCLLSGGVVRHQDLTTANPWPRFSEECIRVGYTAVCAVPMRLGDRVIGCMTIFLDHPGELSDQEVRLAQALADVTTIVILQDQATREAAAREGDLARALTSRIAIEQAKGMIAERFGLDMDRAFSRLRNHARNNNMTIVGLAESLIAGTTPIDDISTLRRAPRPPLEH